jgi:hypothetical protein
MFGCSFELILLAMSPAPPLNTFTTYPNAPQILMQVTGMMPPNWAPTFTTHGNGSQ